MSTSTFTAKGPFPGLLPCTVTVAIDKAGKMTVTAADVPAGGEQEVLQAAYWKLEELELDQYGLDGHARAQVARRRAERSGMPTVKARGWRGIRLTLACGHMMLRDHPEVMGEPPDYWAIGKLAACQVCPVRKRLTGGEVSAVRHVVAVEEVTSPRKPEDLDSIHWYWEGQGH